MCNENKDTDKKCGLPSTIPYHEYQELQELAAGFREDLLAAKDCIKTLLDVIEYLNKEMEKK